MTLEDNQAEMRERVANRARPRRKRIKQPKPGFKQPKPPDPRTLFRTTALDLVAAGRRSLAARVHPDVPGGSGEAMTRVNQVADWLEGLARRRRMSL
jgi:hypothetical protein